MRPRDVIVSVVEIDGRLKVWNASFTLDGTLPRKNGKVDEKARARIERAIADAIEDIDFHIEGGS